jgi:hypothetical protein
VRKDLELLAQRYGAELLAAELRAIVRNWAA